MTQTVEQPRAADPWQPGAGVHDHNGAGPEFGPHTHGSGPQTYAPPPPGRFSGFLLRLYARFPRWTAPLAIVACFAGAAAFVMVREPTDGAFDQTTCLAKLTTGFDCPGCGGTRAFFYLIQGNLPAAARHHLVVVFAAPFLAYMFLAWALNQSFGWRLPQLRPTPLVVSVFLAIAGAFTILRNLPWEPFTWFYV